MVIDQPDRLHEGVTDRWPNELEAAAPQILAHGVGFGRSRGNLLQGFPGIPAGLSAYKVPDIGVETAEFLLRDEEGLRVLDGGGDLEPVANDAGVGEQLPDFVRVVTRDLPGIELVKGTAVIVTLVEDGGPAQAGLGAFEKQELEQDSVIMPWHAPFLPLRLVQLVQEI